MATVHTMLHSVVQGMNTPGEILARVNNLLAADIPAGMFVTCFFAVLDPKSGGCAMPTQGMSRRSASATEALRKFGRLACHLG
jgi:hypothetical protein